MLADRSEAEMGGRDRLATGMRRFAAWKSPGDREVVRFSSRADLTVRTVHP
jgi:hypothetical protein